MVGYGSEDQYFALELTHNYGIESYLPGKDLRCIGVRSRVRDSSSSEAAFAPFDRSFHLAACKRAGATLVSAEGGPVVLSPDGYAFKLVDDSSFEGEDPFLFVSLWVTDPARSLKFWRDALGMVVVDALTVPGASGKGAVYVRAPGGGVALELVPCDRVEHAAAFGRVAFATTASPSTLFKQMVDGRFIGQADSLARVIHKPVRLETPGKADVDVVIIADPDRFEVCLVGDAGFRDLSRTKPGDDFINWEARASLGGDGNPPPSFEGASTPFVPNLVESDAFDSFLAVPERTVVIKVFGTWCAHCAKVSAPFAAFAASMTEMAFAEVDVDRVPSIVHRVPGGLKRVPAFLAFREGELVGSYVGSSNRRLERFVQSLSVDKTLAASSPLSSSLSSSDDGSVDESGCSVLGEAC
jgi:thiol-disulfide isomerase/thioredoxin